MHGVGSGFVGVNMKNETAFQYITLFLEIKV